MKNKLIIPIIILILVFTINVSATNNNFFKLINILEITDTKDNKISHELNEEVKDETITYGDEYNPKFTLKDDSTLSFSSSDENIASFDEDGKIVINNSGTTIITITAPETDTYNETTWSYNLTVNIKKLSKPILNTEKSYSYDEKNKTLIPTYYDSKYMNITGNSNNNPGNYKITISLKNKESTTWDDDSTDDVSFDWNIYKIDTAMYKITSSLSSNKVLDLAGRSPNNRANIQLYTSNNSTAQRFLIKYVKDGYYKIENAYSLKVLDVYDGRAKNSTNVWQFSYNGSAAQLWKIQLNSDGTYTFISKLGNFALDVKGAKTNNKTNIQMYKNNNSKAQKFILTKDNNLTANSSLVNNRSYTISSIISTNQVIDITSGSTANKANVQIYKSNNSLAQKFKITHVRDGYYKIINVKSKKVLDVKGSGKSNGTNVWQYTYNGSSAQLWKIQLNSDGTYTFISRCNGKALDIYDGNPKNRSNVQVYTPNNSNAQKFNLNIKQFIGIDVSSYQKNIDWAKVKNNVDFVVIRAGLYDYIKDANGNDKYQDSKLLRNVEACEKYHIPYALYLYSSAVKVTDADTYYNQGPGGSAQSEAKHMNRILNMLKDKGYKPTMPTQVWYDVEEKETCIDILTDANITGDKRKKLMADIINRFCKDVKNNGYTCGFYSSTNFIDNYIDVKKVLNNGNTLWLAHWTYDTNILPYYNTTNYNMWQYSNSGKISGITGNVDMDTTDNVIK